MAPIVMGDVERGVAAAGLSRLAAVLEFEITAGRSRQQPIRSQEYERLLEVITGGPTFGRGLLAKLGEPMEIQPRWEPLTKPAVAANVDDVKDVEDPDAAPVAAPLSAQTELDN